MVWCCGNAARRQRCSSSFQALDLQPYDVVALSAAARRRLARQASDEAINPLKLRGDKDRATSGAKEPAAKAAKPKAEDLGPVQLESRAGHEYGFVRYLHGGIAFCLSTRPGRFDWLGGGVSSKT